MRHIQLTMQDATHQTKNHLFKGITSGGKNEKILAILIRHHSSPVGIERGLLALVENRVLVLERTVEMTNLK